MRDIVIEETVYFDFTTRAFATGAPTVLAGTPVLSVLEENNATPITAGVSVSIDRASVVGLNMATVVATAANGYENGKGYSVYISTGTVGGVTVVGEKVAEFTIGASSATQDLANGTDGLTALKTGIDAIPTTAMRGTDSAALATVCTETRLAELDAANLPTDIAAIPTTAMRGTDSAALATVCTEARLAELDAANLPADIAAIPTTAMRGTDSAALASVCTETRLAELDAGNLPADIAAIPTTAMRGTDSAATASALATVDSNVDAILVDTSTTLPSLIDDLAVKKNATFSNFEFLMVLTSDHATPATGLTVTGQRSVDGAAFTAVAGTIAEVSNGIYQFDALAADTNGDVITWRFSSATADDTFVTFKTVA